MDLKFGKALGGIAGTLHLYEFFSKIGVEAIFYRKCYRKQLEESDLFFKENEKRISKNLELFDEEYSKKIYLKAIQFRRTHRICDRAPYCKEKEYFNSLTPINDKEVFVDCGGFTGDSVLEFLKFSNNNYKKIISFEPDTINFEKEKENLADIKECQVFNCGVWNVNTKLHFEENNTAGSKVGADEATGIVIDVVALDNVQECREASFIKMDIEGSELMALQGSKNIIINNRPILTICLYHTDEDMLSIPEWMCENLVNYKFYCRHHSYYQQETILYAIPRERLEK